MILHPSLASYQLIIMIITYVTHCVQSLSLTQVITSKQSNKDKGKFSLLKFVDQLFIVPCDFGGQAHTKSTIQDYNSL